MIAPRKKKMVKRNPKNEELAGVGKDLTLIRVRKGLKLIDVAKALNISVSFLSDVENGIKVPGDLTIRKMAELYEMDERILFEMFKKTPLGIIEEVEKYPTLKQTLTELSYSGLLTEEQKKRFYEQVYQLYQKWVSAVSADAEAGQV